MRQETPGAKLTYQDLLALPDDGLRHELIDGVHYVTASPATKHQRILGNLFYEIATFLRSNPIGEAFLAPCDVVISDLDVVVPDLLYVSRERAGIVTEANLRGATDLVVEILSPSTRARDLGIKRDLYERSGVREYWLVDPEAETIAVLRARGGRFDEAGHLARASSRPLTTPLLPGLSLPFDAVFRG